MVASHAATEEPRETELKLRFPPAIRAQIEAHPALQPPEATPPEQGDEHSLYFDTKDHTLAARGLSLRVRRRDGEREQTVKAEGGPGVASRRGEWSWPVTQDRPDLTRLAEVDGELPAALAAGLEPVFSTEIHRTKRRIKLDGSLVEADLDVGQVVAGDRSEQVAELELELLEGDIEPLYRLALRLHADLPLVIGTESKAYRGRRLRGEAPAADVTKAADVCLDASQSAAEALRRVLSVGIGQLVGNLQAAGAGEVEGIHQARVALRRLRAALVLFAPRLEAHAVRHFNDELRRLGRVFGEARDWDVFMLETLPAVQQSSAAAWVPLVRSPAERARGVAHAAVEAEIGRPEITGLVLSLTAWAEDGARHPHLFGHGLEAPIENVAPLILDRLADKLAVRGQHLRRRSAEELHALRKTLKKMRYSADAMESLYGRKGVKAYLKGCKALQQSLGELNDATVTIALLERLAGEGGADLTPACSALSQWSEERREEARRRLGKGWRELEGARRFWK